MKRSKRIPILSVLICLMICQALFSCAPSTENGLPTRGPGAGSTASEAEGSPGKEEDGDDGENSLKTESALDTAAVTGTETVETAETAKTEEPTESAKTEEPTESAETGEPTKTAETTPAQEAPRLSCREEGDGGVVACWWWDGFKATGRRSREKYLDFLSDNGVNRIYLCLPDFKAEQLSAFTRSARERGIAVYLLAGDIAFFDPSSDMAKRVIDAYLEYQRNAQPEEKLGGIHFDVEPHQRADFAQNRDRILDLYAAFAVDAARTLRAAGERVEWDIPFWFDGFTVNAPGGEKRPLLELLAENADTLTLMSYRNSARAILELSKEEIAVCKKYGIGVICGADAYSTEGADVSFAGKGKSEMYDELTQVYNELKAEMDGLPYGVAIHYLDTWYAMKD